jgi:hypothetical protein
MIVFYWTLQITDHYFLHIQKPRLKKIVLIKIKVDKNVTLATSSSNSSKYTPTLRSELHIEVSKASTIQRREHQSHEDNEQNWKPRIIVGTP